MSTQPEKKLIGWKDGEPQYIEQPEQEPFKPDWVSYRQGVADGAAQPEQEPKLSDAGVDTNIPLWGLEPKGKGMLTLHERQWVGLTEDEIKESISNLLEDDPTPLLTLADVIQERLKEKNNAV